MVLLAKRVRAWVSPATAASISVTPWPRAASTTWEKTSAGSLSSIRAHDLDLAETGGARSMAGAHDLLGLPLAAVGHAPKSPVLRPGNGGARIPELGRDPAI